MCDWNSVRSSVQEIEISVSDTVELKLSTRYPNGEMERYLDI